MNSSATMSSRLDKACLGYAECCLAQKSLQHNIKSHGPCPALQMLEYDPDKRITAQEALRHNFFSSDSGLLSLGYGSAPGYADDVTQVALEDILHSASHAEPAEAAVLPRASGKPGSSQVQGIPALQPLKTPNASRQYVHH